MKNLLLLISLGIGLVLFVSCGDGIAPTGDILPKIDTFDCPRPKQQANGLPENMPSKSHKLQRLSPDGTKIAYVVNENLIKILNLKSGTIETYDPKKMMPQNVSFIASGDLHWCPYDDNKLCFRFVTNIDTTGQGRFGAYGQNLFILYRKENKFEMVDLPLMSKIGAESLLLYGWLPGSTNSSDSFFIGYSRGTALITGIVILPEQKIIPIPEFDKLRLEGYLRDYLFSPDRQHSAALVQQLRVSPFKDNIFIDGIPVLPAGSIGTMERLSWSPDGKKLAVTLKPNLGWETVWIIDVDNWLTERPTYAKVQSIDFQKRFCMYNFGGSSIDAEFITNTTLAVSCHHEGDVLCPLWEITTDGRLLRQITHDD